MEIKNIVNNNEWMRNWVITCLLLVTNEIIFWFWTPVVSTIWVCHGKHINTVGFLKEDYEWMWEWSLIYKVHYRVYFCRFSFVVTQYHAPWFFILGMDLKTNKKEKFRVCISIASIFGSKGNFKQMLGHILLYRDDLIWL